MEGSNQKGKNKEQDKGSPKTQGRQGLQTRARMLQLSGPAIGKEVSENGEEKERQESWRNGSDRQQGTGRGTLEASSKLGLTGGRAHASPPPPSRELATDARTDCVSSLPELRETMFFMCYLVLLQQHKRNEAKALNTLESALWSYQRLGRKSLGKSVKERKHIKMRQLLASGKKVT